MITQVYLAKMKDIQHDVLQYLEKEDDVEENYEKLIHHFNNHKIQEDKNVLKSVLYLILRISNNHHRTQNFFSKINKMIQFFQSSITKFFTNNEIFDIFKSNKKILLFLIKEKILIFNQYIADTMTKEKYIEMKYPHFFAPEINPFLSRHAKLEISYFDNCTDEEQDEEIGEEQDEEVGEKQDEKVDEEQDEEVDEEVDEKQDEKVDDEQDEEVDEEVGEKQDENVGEEQDEEVYEKQDEEIYEKQDEKVGEEQDEDIVEESFDDDEDNGTKPNENEQNKNCGKDKDDIEEEEEYAENQNFLENILKNAGKDFEEKRNAGENDNEICEIIRNDKPHELVRYFYESKSSYLNPIKQSIFETNRFLLKKRNHSIIEYSAYCGSTEILGFLLEVEPITDRCTIKSLWEYAVHSNNLEIIRILEKAYKKQTENEAERIPENLEFDYCICLSIQCHHNEIANYIHSNILKSKEEIKLIDNSVVFHHYNFAFFPKIFNNKTFFSYLCQYDYFIIVKDLLQTKKWNLNLKVICNIFPPIKLPIFVLNRIT